jgi:hypothetical protein
LPFLVSEVEPTARPAYPFSRRRCGEMADAADLKSAGV